MNSDEKSTAMLMWILCLFIHLLSPLIFGFAVAKDKSGLLYQNAMQALVLQLFCFVIVIALVITVVGMLLAPVVGLVYLIFVIMGAIAANKGEVYSPPITGNLAKKWFNLA